MLFQTGDSNSLPPIPELPEPDLIAPRNTDQWRDAVHQRKKLIAQYLAQGGDIDELFGEAKWGEGGSSREGRLSHDYEYWSKALRGETLGDEGLPSELGEAEWNIGNFRRQIHQGDWTEWPPGSGMFFNDPANDPGARQWRNQFGVDIPPPEDPGPDIDYNIVNEGYGGSIKNYLSGEAARRQDERKKKPITMGGKIGGQPKNPTSFETTPPPKPTNAFGSDQVWGGFNTMPNQQPFATQPTHNKPMNNSANVQAAMTGDSNLPSRFNVQPALDGGSNAYTNPQTPSRAVKNPFGVQKPRPTFGLGWR